MYLGNNKMILGCLFLALAILLAVPGNTLSASNKTVEYLHHITRYNQLPIVLNSRLINYKTVGLSAEDEKQFAKTLSRIGKICEVKLVASNDPDYLFVFSGKEKTAEIDLDRLPGNISIDIFDIQNFASTAPVGSMHLVSKLHSGKIKGILIVAISGDSDMQSMFDKISYCILYPRFYYDFSIHDDAIVISNGRINAIDEAFLYSVYNFRQYDDLGYDSTIKKLSTMMDSYINCGGENNE